MSANNCALRMADEQPRVAGRELAVAHQRLHRLGQLQQPHQVGDIRPALADDLRHLLLRVIALLHQRDIAGRFLDRIEVGALHVLDDGEFERLHVGRIDDGDRHLVQAGALRRAPAPLAGDDLEIRRRASRTTIGWMMPRSLIDEASSSSCASVKVRRGLRGLGFNFSIGALRGLRGASVRASAGDGSSPTSPISAARPRPNRLCSAIPAAPDRSATLRFLLSSILDPSSPQKAGHPVASTGVIQSRRTCWIARLRGAMHAARVLADGCYPAAFSARSRWMISVASRKYASLPTHFKS